MFHKGKHFNLLKSISVKLNESTTFILVYMYYTDRYDKNNNQYRYEGLVVNNAEYEGLIRKYEDNPIGPWHWKHSISDDYFVMYHKNDTLRAASAFMKNRLSKALTNWDEFTQKLNENAVKRYPTTGYIIEGTNEEISITDKEKLLSLAPGTGMSRVRDRAEKTFDIFDPNRKFRRYNSAIKRPLKK